MTGSGKTGLLLVLAEEALRAGVPVLLIDVKGDLANLLLTFPNLSAAEFAPWTGPDAAESTASAAREGLAAWNLSAADVAALHHRVAPRVITPGSSCGEPLDVLSAVERHSPLWVTDDEAARESLSAGLTLLLHLMARNGDPATSRDHAVLSVLAEQRLRAGQSATVEELLGDVESPPVERIGAMALDAYFPKRARHELATALNTLLASPTFASWRRGAALDVAGWMAPRADGRVPAVVLSVAHLSEEERGTVLGLVLQEVLGWVRGRAASGELEALVVFDEVYGWIPPHPASPPTKAPLVKLMKQGRAFGVGVVLATQNPMDLDYRALGNAGLWFVGRLQTDADRARVVEGMAGAGEAGGAGEGASRAELDAAVKKLARRWWVVKDGNGVALMQTRWALCWLKGPLTRAELKRVVRDAGEEAGEGARAADRVA